MLIGICGAKCAGKSTVAQFLIEHHGFKKLHILEEAAASRDEVGKEQKSGPGSSTLPSHPKQTVATTTTEQEQHVFPTAQALLDFVTKRWRSRWVTTDVRDEAILDALSRRPFFLLISVDAPVTVRWRRWQQQQQQQQQQKTTSSSSSSSSPAEEATTSSSDNSDSDATSLAEFVAQSDAQLYSAGPGTGAGAGMLELMSRASVRLLNSSASSSSSSSSLADLHASLAQLDLTNSERLRPGWDGYFMALASLAARRCNCMKRAVGCVLVDNATGGHRVISTGYNGTPRSLRNCGEGGCPRCNGSPDGGDAYSGPGFGGGSTDSGAALATCLCLHAEENALLEAGRERIRPGAVLYCNTCPCLTCSIKIVQVGIGEVVYNQAYSMDGAAAEVFRSAGVKLRQFSPPANGLIHLEKMDLC